MNLTVNSESLETEIINGGHATERLSGVDLYDTNIAVVNKASVESGTPVIVTSGEDFPDALSVSGFAGSNQYPILLVGKNYLSEKTQNYISTIKPSMVYIAGGASVVSQSLKYKKIFYFEQYIAGKIQIVWNNYVYITN